MVFLVFGVFLQHNISEQISNCFCLEHSSSYFQATHGKENKGFVPRGKKGSSMKSYHFVK